MSIALPKFTFITKIIPSIENINTFVTNVFMLFINGNPFITNGNPFITNGNPFTTNGNPAMVKRKKPGIFLFTNDCIGILFDFCWRSLRSALKKLSTSLFLLTCSLCLRVIQESNRIPIAILNHS